MFWSGSSPFNGQPETRGRSLGEAAGSDHLTGEGGFAGFPLDWWC